MIVFSTDPDYVAPMRGAVTVVIDHPAVPRGTAETHTFRESWRAPHGVEHHAWSGLFEPTQDYGITEAI